ncbi:carotenoid biosynthesis protein [Meiothermus sp. QL-1]|nr:carotenoid biosynthesis protein [Meiothermus sp. QL-1]
MGLALGGAALLVGGEGLGAALAVGGVGLALLWAWGADLLWGVRGPILRVALLAGLLGGGLGFALGGGGLAWVWAGVVGLLVAQARWMLALPEAWARLRLWRLEAWAVLLVLAGLVRVPVPLWPEGFPWLALAQMLLLCLAALAWGLRYAGVRVLGAGALVFALGLGVEVIGSRTGLPFGSYTYEGAPGPRLLGVPLIVPMGWFALGLSAHLLAGGRPGRAGLLLVAWDLGLEALMTAQGYWRWYDPHPLWYGAPLQNYLAWFGVGYSISWLYGRLLPGLREGFGWAYRLEALFLPVGLALMGFWPAALASGLAMNALAAWGGVRGR